MSPGMQEQASIVINARNNASGAIQNITQQLGGMKTIALGAGVAVGAALAKKAVSAAADFDQAMTKSMAVMGDVGESMEKQLADKAREVAKTTTKSHEEAANSYYFLASAGLDASQSLEAMPEVAQFSEAAAMDMARATDYATDISKQFGIEADNLTKVTDTLAATFTRHNQTAKGMGEAMSYAGAVASGLGISIEETATAIGMMGDAGIKGSRAGRSLRQALNRLTDPPSNVADKLDKMGVQVTNSEGDLLSLSEIMTQLEEAGADTSDIMEIFGTRAGPAMQSLLQEGGDAIAENTNEISKMGGVTEEVAEKQRDTLNAQMDIFKSRINDVAITIGNYLMPAVNVILNGLMKLGGWLNKHLGPIIEKYILPAFRRLGKFLKTVFTPVIDFLKEHGKTLIKVALTPLAATIRILWNIIKPFVKKVLIPFAKWLGPKLVAAGKALKKVLEPLSPLLKPIKAAFNALLSVLKSIYMWVWGNSLVPALWKLVDVLKFVGNLLKNTVITIFKGFKKIVRTVYNKGIKPLANGIKSFWNNTLSPVVDFIKNMVIVYFKSYYRVAKLLWNKGIKPLANGVKWFWDTILSPVVNFIKNMVIIYFRSWYKIAKTVWDKGVKPLANGIEWFWNKILSPVVDFIKNTVITAFRGFEKILDGIGGAVEWVANKIETLLGPLKGVMDTLGDVGGAVKNIFGGSPGGQLEDSLKHAEKTAKRYAPKIQKPLNNVSPSTSEVTGSRQGRESDNVNVNVGGDLIVRADDPDEFRQKLRAKGIRRR